MWLITTRSFSPRCPDFCKDFALRVSVGLALFFAIIELVVQGSPVGGWPFFYVVLPSQDKLSARAAAVAADVHVAVIPALLVTTTSAVLAPVTCDLGVEQRQRHL